MSSLLLSGSGVCHACPQFVLALFNFTRQLAVFWPKVCHACRQFVLALFNFTRQLVVFRPKVPGHPVDSLEGTPATFMGEA